MMLDIQTRRGWMYKCTEHSRGGTSRPSSWTGGEHERAFAGEPFASGRWSGARARFMEQMRRDKADQES